ncbi:hypothetical protein K1W69_17305 [Hoeflea sp. WL0058]|uniref:Uncharacterized protein n=1 Tax=Flavimaribacter sediminis TaxID=2865987 RepID=A0AAE2ZSY9_9HYPH|nr:hypothetical protein [Flavimaribacter sediminis]MBW8638957.1 hypothetical protein [Flavimaribacter sediminis]
MKRKPATEEEVHEALVREVRMQHRELSEPRDWRCIGDRDEKALWKRYETLPQKARNDGARRLAAILESRGLWINGLGATASANLGGRRHGVSARTIFRWRAVIFSWDKRDWLAALTVMRSWRDAR